MYIIPIASDKGYYGTPLAKKLGLKAGSTIRLVNEPEAYQSLFTDWPDGVTIIRQEGQKTALIHFFVRRSEELFEQLPLLKKEVTEAGAIWVSWPKKASKQPTDITEETIRNLALRIGLVDVKVCAVDATWSGLKLMIPIAQRQKA